MRRAFVQPVAPASGVHGLECPACREPALEDTGPDSAACRACGATFETVRDVTCAAEVAHNHGNCCAGMRRYDVDWERGGERGHAVFETWVQHAILLRPGDRFTLLYEPGERERRHPMARWIVNHTLVEAWPVP